MNLFEDYCCRILKEWAILNDELICSSGYDKLIDFNDTLVPSKFKSLIELLDVKPKWVVKVESYEVDNLIIMTRSFEKLFKTDTETVTDSKNFIVSDNVIEGDDSYSLKMRVKK